MGKKNVCGFPAFEAFSDLKGRRSWGDRWRIVRWTCPSAWGSERSFHATTLKNHGMATTLEANAALRSMPAAGQVRSHSAPSDGSVMQLPGREHRGGWWTSKARGMKSF